MGFFTHRWVEAMSAKEAELAVLDMLRDEFQFSDEAKLQSPDAKVYFEQVVKVASGEASGPNRGATWFPMDEV